jgi:Caspase domain/Glucodextranase, domain B
MKKILFILMLLVITAQIFAGGAPEDFMRAIRNFDITTSYSVKNVEEGLKKGIKLTNEYKPYDDWDHGAETPMNWFLSGCYTSIDSISNSISNEKIDSFQNELLSFLYLDSMISNNEGFYLSEKFQNQLYQGDPFFYPIFADKNYRFSHEYYRDIWPYSILVLIQLLENTNHEFKETLKEYITKNWNVDGISINNEKVELRALGAVLGLGEFSINDTNELKTLFNNPESISSLENHFSKTAELLTEDYINTLINYVFILDADEKLMASYEVNGLYGNGIWSTTSERFYKWVRAPFKKDKVLDIYILTYIEKYNTSDVPIGILDNWKEPTKWNIFTALGYTTSRGKTEHLEHLISLGLHQDTIENLKKDFPIESPDEWSLTPIDWFKYANINNVSVKKKSEIVNYLLDLNFRLSRYSYPSSGRTLLHVLAGMVDISTTQRLIDLGLDPLKKTKNGFYPFDLANSEIKYPSRQQKEIIEYLKQITFGGIDSVIIVENNSEVIKDTKAPRIRLNNLDSERGIDITEGQSYDAVTTFPTINIAGIVVDESEIISIIINGISSEFNNFGEFESSVSLLIGENSIEIKAKDKANNEALESIIILRKEAKTLADELGIQGAFYALVIGNENYNSLNSLETPHEDAREIASLLGNQYNFDVKLLLDADRSEILNSFNEYTNKMKEDDTFLLYYAGHGYYDKDADLAYWLPVDAESDDDTNWILANRITGNIRKMAAKHVALISDSCYSGTLTRDAIVDLSSTQRGEAEYLRKMLEKKSRTILASGGNEPVADGGGGKYSIFAKYFIQALSSSKEQVISLEQLFYEHIRTQVAGNAMQIPEYKTIRNSGHEGGDFVFVRN